MSSTLTISTGSSPTSSTERNTLREGLTFFRGRGTFWESCRFIFNYRLLWDRGEKVIWMRVLRTMVKILGKLQHSPVRNGLVVGSNPSQRSQRFMTIFWVSLSVTEISGLTKVSSLWWFTGIPRSSLRSTTSKIITEVNNLRVVCTISILMASLKDR